MFNRMCNAHDLQSRQQCSYDICGTGEHVARDISLDLPG